jgi:hypothetical protein
VNQPLLDFLAAGGPSCFFDIPDKIWENLFVLLAVGFRYFAAGGPPFIRGDFVSGAKSPPFYGFMLSLNVPINKMAEC